MFGEPTIKFPPHIELGREFIVPPTSFFSITNQGFRKLCHFLQDRTLLAKGDGSPLGAKGHSAQIHLLTGSQHQLIGAASVSSEAKSRRSHSAVKNSGPHDPSGTGHLHLNLEAGSPDKQREAWGEYTSHQWHQCDLRLLLSVRQFSIPRISLIVVILVAAVHQILARLLRCAHMYRTGQGPLAEAAKPQGLHLTVVGSMA